MIFSLIEPAGAATSTVSPFLCPSTARPTGDSFESLFAAGSASADPTISYSSLSPPSTYFTLTLVPTLTTSVPTAAVSITRAERSCSLSRAIRASSSACSFFASSYSEFSEMSPNSRASRIRSATSRRLTVSSSSICSLSFSNPARVRMTSFSIADPCLVHFGQNERCRRQIADFQAIQVSADTVGRGIVPAATRTVKCGSVIGRRDLRLSPRYPLPAMAKLTGSWQIGGVEIPSRIVLAPMAGVSVQAFRRQGRRYGAGLVCSEMVSSCGLSYGNERTLGYLRIARDEHPLAVQIFGSEPERMAEAAGMVVDAGADIVDINFGCPVRKVTKTGAGASALEDHEMACRVAGAVVDAVDVPVTVKMRRGLKNGSRAALDLGPRLEDLGVAALTLHPRSAQQMYTGFADHTLTAELVG